MQGTNPKDMIRGGRGRMHTCSRWGRRRTRRRRAGVRPFCTAPPLRYSPRPPAHHHGTPKSARGTQRHPRSERDLGGRVAHRLGGEGRRGLFPAGGEGRHHEPIRHAAPALPAAAPEDSHRGRGRRGGGRGIRVRVGLGGGRVGLEDVSEREPGGAVDREAVGLATAAASRHRAEKGREGEERPGAGGRWVGGGGRRWVWRRGGRWRGARVCAASDGNLDAAV